MTKVSFGSSYGTLGELFQGPFILNNQVHISIISLPIPKYSWATFTKGINNNNSCELKNKIKCKKAVDIFLQFSQNELPQGQWSFYSELKEGKGMASSTADIIATLRCLQMHYQKKIKLDIILSILSNIERSDSVFIDDFVLYLSRRQKIIEKFSSRPKLYAIYIDEDYEIDTDEVGDKLMSYYEKNITDYSTVLNYMLKAFRENDVRKICRCSTQSAILSQKIIPKKEFKQIISNKEKFNADGLIVAHTGSLIGYLFIKKPSLKRTNEIQNFFNDLNHSCDSITTGF